MKHGTFAGWNLRKRSKWQSTNRRGRCCWRLLAKVSSKTRQAERKVNDGEQRVLHSPAFFSRGREGVSFVSTPQEAGVNQRGQHGKRESCLRSQFQIWKYFVASG